MKQSVMILVGALAGTGAAAQAQTAAPCAAPTGTAPSGVTVAPSGPNLVIAWTAVPKAAGYAVVRKNPDGTCWALTPQGTTATSFQEPIPSVAGNYGYQIGVRLLTGQNGLGQFVVYQVQPPPVIITPPPRGTPTIMDDALPPVNLTATGTPTTATVTWGAPSAAVNYRVNRAPAGTTSWTAVTPTPIGATTVTDVLPDPAQPYTYSVLAYRKDGHYGAASVNFTAPRPTNPTGLVGTATGSSVTLSWQPVQYATRYGIRGPGISGTALTTTTTFTVGSAPTGNNGYRVGSIFDPGALQTAVSAWSTVTVPVVAPTSCACTATGPFTAPMFNLLTAKTLSTTFTSPVGVFRIDARSLNGNNMLDVFDSNNRSLFSETNPAGWGLSPSGAYFVVAMPPLSANTGANVRVFLVRPGPQKWNAALDIDVWPNGYWGFSGQNSQFIVIQSQASQFSFQAYNLRASNPRSAMVQGTSNVAGSQVTVSPCGDRLLYAQWTQLSPLNGQGDFYTRSTYGSGQLPLITHWDGMAPVTPTASAVAGPSPNTFLVQLNGLKTAGGQTTIPSAQCSP
ncbi:MAG: hypothetical protein ACKVZ0_09660 [Gemmatimonadales bacterium]